MEYQNNIFSVPIWGVVLKNQKSYLQDYIDFILDLEKSEPSTKRSNTSGYQTKNTLHKEGIFFELVNLFSEIANDIGTHLKFPKLEIDSLWANINRYKDCNITHIHQGVISGVFYLTVPQNSGKLVLCNPATRADCSIFADREYYIDPIEMSCIFFPSWLEHYVEPNLNLEKSRISLGFNFVVERK